VSVIAIANPKGGSGKSTLATNLAGLLARQGHAVMLGDIDKQQSSRRWLGLRPAAMPRIDSWDVLDDQVLRPPKGTTHVVLDTPAGLDGKSLDDVLKVADLVLVPIQASVFDILATHDFLTALQAHPRASSFRTGVVATRVRENTNANDRLNDYLVQHKIPLVAALRDTQNYVHVCAHGLTIWDITPSRVERDLTQWAPLARWVGA
jgi:chromosome partitioning protein